MIVMGPGDRFFMLRQIVIGLGSAVNANAHLHLRAVRPRHFHFGVLVIELLDAAGATLGMDLVIADDAEAGRNHLSISVSMDSCRRKASLTASAPKLK